VAVGEPELAADAVKVCCEKVCVADGVPFVKADKLAYLL